MTHSVSRISFRNMVENPEIFKTTHWLRL